MVWPRDCCETVGAMVAAGAGNDCIRVLAFLRAAQEADGHWPQTMWLTGGSAQDGLQLGEAALPTLAVDLVERDSDASDKNLVAEFWPMIGRAARFITECAPATQEDRWEHNPGYTPYTLAAGISVLLVAGGYADRLGEPASGQVWCEIADAWEASTDAWLYARDTDLAKRCGVDGYYVRVAPQDAR